MGGISAGNKPETIMRGYGTDESMNYFARDRGGLIPSHLSRVHDPSGEKENILVEIISFECFGRYDCICYLSHTRGGLGYK